MTSVLTALGVLGLLVYLASFVWAAVAAWNAPPAPELHPFIHQVLVVIGPALATYLGAKLGIDINRGKRIGALANPLNVPVLAIWVYVISLFGSVVVWLVRPETTPQELQQLAGSLIGILVGVLTIILATEPR